MRLRIKHLLFLLLLCTPLQAEPTIKVYLRGFEYGKDLRMNIPELLYKDASVTQGILFSCGVGEKGKEDKISHTPVGTFKVIYMSKDPIYIDVNGKKIAGPYRLETPPHLNVYGTRIIGLNYKRNGRHLAIHGTNEPELLPGYVSRMCVRLKNEDVEWLFNRVNVGDIVEIIK